MQYVERASIVLLDHMDIEVTGKEAQRIYQEVQKDHFSYVRVNLNDRIVVIPRESIVYIVFEPNKKANELQKRIDQHWERVFQLTGIKDDEDGDWYVRDNITYLGYRKVSEDPKVADLLIELEHLQEQLEELMPQDEEEES
ncbi:hypothetical protein [Thermoflavimicrobium dichotomicum]|uniref:Uncharacterized protein n=1 Tax=Thermoflavimicrobium dichotomicum TaxID=46223 RepID=A0A1I3UUE2_9BACL|nr:hypothetical protein [Thermoflavimicrobium dichotomicum]SFJ86570.1 hypothetical protein SAMN05421852_12815 [Thermoflavimicrobium dichotomicum]